MNIAPDASVMLATGADEVYRLGVPPNVEVLKLPGLRKVANEQYAARRLQIRATEIRELRCALLKATVRSFRPDVMLVDKHPIGASGELRPALDILKAAGGRAVLGLRDILDERGQVIREWARHDLHHLIDHYYDQVLVYGHESVLDPVREYGLPAPVAQRTHFCGYVLNPSGGVGRSTDSPPEFLAGARARPVVLATPGGGEDGFQLLEAFIRASVGAPWQGVVVTGPMLPADGGRALQRLGTESGVLFYTFVPALSEWFGLVDGLVCMGGYNTLVEAIYRGAPTVCVPRTTPRTEQLIRARAFAGLGLLRAVEPEGLDAASLQREIAAMLKLSRRDVLNRAHACFSFDGARRAAEYLAELAALRAGALAVAAGEFAR